MSDNKNIKEIEEAFKKWFDILPNEVKNRCKIKDLYDAYTSGYFNGAHTTCKTLISLL